MESIAAKIQANPLNWDKLRRNSDNRAKKLTTSKVTKRPRFSSSILFQSGKASSAAEDQQAGGPDVPPI